MLAVEDLHLAKQGSMTSEEFHSHILQIIKRCRFPNQRTEERASRDAIFIGMNSQRARDRAINLMNEEGKEVTVGFLMNHLAVEDGNTQECNHVHGRTGIDLGQKLVLFYSAPFLFHCCL